jgi:hypothetical protein
MNQLKCGFKWTVERIVKGEVVEVEETYNLVPIEGLDYFLNTGLKNGTPYANFYIGLYEGAYTPVPGDTAATFPSSATELTAYVEATRPILTLGAISAGAVDNSAAKAVFTGNTNGKLAQGGFISSVPTKGAATGILVSAVKFPSPKALDAGGILRATAAFNIVSI